MNSKRILVDIYVDHLSSFGGTVDFKMRRMSDSTWSLIVNDCRVDQYGDVFRVFGASPDACWELLNDHMQGFVDGVTSFRLHRTGNGVTEQELPGNDLYNDAMWEGFHQAKAHFSRLEQSE